MIRVYIADDSPTVVHLFQMMLEGAPDIRVVGTAGDGLQAKAEVQLLKPDVLVTDLWMPGLDGYGLISWVMSQQPTPILVLSDAVDRQGSEAVVKCLALGALEARAKPRAGTSEQFAQSRVEFLFLLRALSGVKTVRRWSLGDRREEVPAATPHSAPPTAGGQGRLEVVAIGASTGGPQVLQAILSRLPVGFQLPILLALHIEAGFMEGMRSWLKSITPLRVLMGVAEGVPEPGTVYLPREGQHLVVTPNGRLGNLRPLPFETLLPSVDRLFASVAEAYGSRACGIILTGMGRDGAAGLKAMRAARARTIAQDEASCIIYGMPKVALEMGGVERSMSPDQMVVELLKLGLERNGGGG